jgi:hypothetical protein
VSIGRRACTIVLAFDRDGGEYDLPDYHLANEGSGIALNIRSGVAIGDIDYEFGDGPPGKRAASDQVCSRAKPVAAKPDSPLRKRAPFGTSGPEPSLE